MWSSAFQIAYVIYDYCSVLSLNIFSRCFSCILLVLYLPEVLGLLQILHLLEVLSLLKVFYPGVSIG